MPFVETSVSRDIFRTIELALDLQKNGAIVGRPGVGKTLALMAYAEQRKTVMMTATAISGNALRDLFSQLSDALGIHTSGSIANVQRQLHQYDLSGRALIIDEAQNLKLQAFRELLHLHDFTGLCLIFCGNEEVLKRVNTDKGAFAQINRRVPIRLEVNSILDDDTDQLASAYGVEGMDAHRMLRSIGRVHHTYGVVDVLTLAQRIVAGKTIKADHIRRGAEPYEQYRRLLK